MLPREPVLSGVRGWEAVVCQALCITSSSDMSPFPLSPGAQSNPRTWSTKFSHSWDLLASSNVALSFLGPPVPRSCPAWKLWPWSCLSCWFQTHPGELLRSRVSQPRGTPGAAGVRTSDICGESECLCSSLRVIENPSAHPSITALPPSTSREPSLTAPAAFTALCFLWVLCHQLRCCSPTQRPPSACKLQNNREEEAEKNPETNSQVIREEGRQTKVVWQDRTGLHFTKE